MDYLEIAKKISQKAHNNQKYSKGNHQGPYFNDHIEEVVKILKNMGYKDKVLATAYLHDVLEDTSVTPKELLSSGIPEDIVQAVIALTKDKSRESNQEYVERLLKNKLAIPVKFADSTHNYKTTVETKEVTSQERYEHLLHKYEYNLIKLKPFLPRPEDLV